MQECYKPKGDMLTQKPQAPGLLFKVRVLKENRNLESAKRAQHRLTLTPPPRAED